MSFTSPSRTSIIRAPRPRARRPTASASAFTKRCSMSSTVSPSARRCIVRSTSCRPIWIPGSRNTMRRGHIRDVGASENPNADLPGCDANSEGENDRSLTISDTKTRPLNQHQLSDRVPANTLARAIAALGPSNTLIVTKLDRLARSARDLLNHPRRNRQRWGNLSVVARCLGGHDNAPWAIDADGAGRPCGIRTSSDPCQDPARGAPGPKPKGSALVASSS